MAEVSSPLLLGAGATTTETETTVMDTRTMAIIATTTSNRYEAHMAKFHKYRKLEWAALSSDSGTLLAATKYAFLANYFHWLAARELLKIANTSHASLRNSRKSSAMKQINYWAAQMAESFTTLQLVNELARSQR